MKSQSPVRVLVFGGTGVGKTSLCNALTGRSRPTDDGPKGVTDKTHFYSRVQREGLALEVVDTVGLHEAESGTVPAEVAARQLVELLAHSKDGFSLLIHVAKRGRLTKQHEDDYEFFVRRMTSERIPVLLVLTGCETDLPMTAWVEKHRKHFNRFNYRDIIPTCFASGGTLEDHFAPLRQISEAAVLKAIGERALPEPTRLFGEGTGRDFTQFLAKVWNDFVELAGLPDKYRAKVNESVYQFLVRMGVSRKLADLCIKHLPDLLGDMGGKLPVPGSGTAIKRVTKMILERLLGRTHNGAGAQ